MGIEVVREHFQKWGREKDILEFSGSSATVGEAAEQVGCEPARIAKTLTFRNGESALVLVTAGDMKVDNIKFKTFFGFKPKMLTPDEALNFTGHSVGGVCPFGLAEALPVYLDESMKRFDVVYPACGSSNSAIRLTLEELEEFSGCERWIDVCK